MDAQDKKDLADAVVAAMQEHHRVMWIDPEIHSEHHKLLPIMAAQLEAITARETRIVERNARIKEKVAGTFIVGVSVATIGLIGAGVIEWLKLHLLIK